MSISVDLSSLQAKFDEIAVLDEQIDAARGSGEPAGKRAVRNRTVAAHEEALSANVSTLADWLGGLDQDALVAAHTLVSSVLREFNETVDKFLETEVAKQPPVAEKSDVDMTATIESRKALVKEYNALRNILEMFNQDVDSVPVPKVLRGAAPGTKRGPSAIAGYTWTYNGETYKSFRGVPASAKDIRAAAKAQGVDLANPADTVTFELNGSPLVGTKGVVTPDTAAAVAASSDDDDDFEDDEF